MGEGGDFKQYFLPKHATEYYLETKVFANVLLQVGLCCHSC